MNNFLFFIVSCSIIILAAIAILIYEKKTKWEGADERQLLETMKSSTIGFYTLIALNLIVYAASRNLSLPFKSEILIIIATLIAFTIYMIREIWIDNIWSSKINGKLIAVFLFVLVGIDSYKFLSAYAARKVLENLILGLSFPICYFACILSFALRKLLKKEVE